MTGGGLQHVALPTLRAGVDAEVAFWSLLGFSRVTPPSSLADRSSWVRAADGTQIHLLYASEINHAGHVAIVAPAFEETLAALRAAGFTPEPRTPHWDAPRAYVHTPGGHLVELMASAPPSA